MIRPIRDQWKSYRREVLSPEAPDVQVTETRRAFYAGAASLLSTLYGALSTEGEEATEADERFLVAIHAEIEAFNESVGRGNDAFWDEGAS